METKFDLTLSKAGRLCLAVRENDFQEIRRLTDKELDPEQCVGDKALELSCIGGDLLVAKYLIEEHSCNPHGPFISSTEIGLAETPLYVAVEHGHVDLVKYLIETCHCDSIMYKTLTGDTSTALHTSCQNRCCLDVVKYLVENHHCDLYRIDEYGMAPIHHAIQWKHLDIVKYLIEKAHFDPNYVQDKDGATLLHNAAYHSFLELVKYLLVVHHCDPNCKTKFGSTPLDFTVIDTSQGHPAVVRELIKAGGYSTLKMSHSPVKEFIIGNPSSGKSSLTKALQTEKSALGMALSSITGRRLVSDVEQKTAGIVPCQFNSRRFGSVTLYDFAGQQEYYASHAALLQNSISSSAPLFIIALW